MATNPGEQFHVFANLAVWLLNQCGRKLAQPEEVSWELTILTFLCKTVYCIHHNIVVAIYYIYVCMYLIYILQSDDPNSSTAAIMEEARKLVLEPRSHFKLHFNFLSFLYSSEITHGFSATQTEDWLWGTGT